MFSARPVPVDDAIDELEPGDELGDAQMVPDGAKDVKKISSLSFIRMFLSGRLSFPNETKEFCFGYEDLIDLGPIGDGAYGRVNKMCHNETGRNMAVKKVRIISGKNDDVEENRSLRRLRQEVEAIRSASDCPQIVRFYGLTFHEGDCLVCMELMDISLKRLYHIVHSRTPGVFDERILGHVAVSILKALSHLKNEIKIIHRDVKPSNILLDLRGMIKLCDFGISGYLVNSVAQSREAGCRPYMAPERLLTNAAYDIRSDVWSLGITLREVAMGEFPYPRFNDNELFFQLQQVVYGDPPIMGPSDVYSITTVKFINSCLIKDMNLRPDYKTLMRTDFFNHYDSLDGTPLYIAAYVQNALEGSKQSEGCAGDC
ncbi:Dual specificity mitogen-activated protein kinase kinase 2 [Toxocara canis]|uniref:mitogen-activated protein kinase kinase n=1 Tax=Toxocara canis TaxID=6265 RepID=A0A0B2UUA8_TOXCA|nr:Dual specificity mitogen-activated protein kinase kinase 2 [Toxocara canis]